MMLLMILDGWGYREETDFNAIAHANTPNWDKLWAERPRTLIRASESAVGLPSQQMGNSEVGHLNIGAGRVVYQEYTRVSRAIRDGSFYENATLTGGIDQAVASGGAVHIMGLLSPGGVHSHEEHLQAMVQLAHQRGATKIYVHAFLDGRDTSPRSASDSISAMQAVMDATGCARFASVIGRYFAMDRDHRWPRIKAAYDLITDGVALHQSPSAAQALEMAYARDETDEFVEATAILDADGAPIKMCDGDVLFFMNFRSDRARQVTRPFVEPNFDCFERSRPLRLGDFICLTEYSDNFETPVAFPPVRLKNTFGAWVSQLGLRQLRIAETEKYAHVTFFFNGGEEAPFEGEERLLVQSPNVATYDLQPQMNAPLLTERLIEAIQSRKFDVIICNYANPDMVGHTGNFDATVQAIEALDVCVGQVLEALEAEGGEALITADHGNAELMMDVEKGQPHTAHTTNLVPLVFVGREADLAATGSLCDLAPTMLSLMGQQIPQEMNGRSLVSLKELATS